MNPKTFMFSFGFNDEEFNKILINNSVLSIELFINKLTRNKNNREFVAK